MRVLKFGGSSLADYACLQQVAQLVKAQLKDEMLLVLSAPGGMTDSLVALASAAEQGSDFSQQWQAAQAAIAKRGIATRGRRRTSVAVAACSFSRKVTLRKGVSQMPMHVDDTMCKLKPAYRNQSLTLGDGCGDRWRICCLDFFLCLSTRALRGVKTRKPF